MFRALISAMAVMSCLAAAVSQTAWAQTPPVAEFKIHIAEPVYVGLPIWIRADLPETLTARYPYTEDPSWFGPNRIELKRSGQIVTPASFASVASAGGVADGSIAPTGSPTNQLPVHLRYLLDQPGTYSIRWTVVRREVAASRRFVETVVAQSNVLTFEVHASNPEQRDSWIKREATNVPTDPGLVAGDFLPSAMVAAPDGRILRAAMEQSYSANDAVSAYALGCTRRFLDGDVHSQTIEIIHQKGPNERLAYLISQRRELFARDTERLVRIVIPYLSSGDDGQTAGALRMLIFTAHPGGSSEAEHPDIRKVADEAVLAAAPSLLTHGQKTAGPLAEFLGGVKSDGSRDLLWKIFAGSNGGNQQALIALTWIANPGDLPRLAELLVKPGDGDANGRDRAGLINSLRHAYGDSAVPYLEKAIVSSPYAFVRLQAAEELGAIGSPIAFRFFLDTVNQNPFYRAEAIRWLKGQFYEDLSSSSDDSAVAAFLKRRLGQ